MTRQHKTKRREETRRNEARRGEARRGIPWSTSAWHGRVYEALSHRLMPPSSHATPSRLASLSLSHSRSLSRSLAHSPRALRSLPARSLALCSPPCRFSACPDSASRVNQPSNLPTTHEPPTTSSAAVGCFVREVERPRTRSMARESGDRWETDTAPRALLPRKPVLAVSVGRCVSACLPGMVWCADARLCLSGSCSSPLARDSCASVVDVLHACDSARVSSLLARA